MKRNNNTVLGVVGLVLLAGYVAVRGFLPSDSTPDPSPVDPIVVVTLDQAAEQGHNVEAIGKAKVYRDAATIVRRGDIKTAAELLKYLSDNIEPARRSANQPLLDMLAAQLPSTTIDNAEDTATKLDKVAEGLERFRK